MVLCDISAWQYRTTPPSLREIDIPLEAAARLASASRYPLPKANRKPPSLRTVDRIVLPRLLTDLKGVSVPVQVMTDGSNRRARAGLLHPMRLRTDLSKDECHPLGNGLYVTSPEATLRHLARFERYGSLLERMFEACGIYAIAPKNDRMRHVLHELQVSGVLSKQQAGNLESTVALTDEQGRKVPRLARDGDEKSWVPSFDRQGMPTDLWKRPPLTSAEALLDSLETARSRARFRGANLAFSAARQVFDGSGSPFETKAAILMFTDERKGGEGWDRPLLNHTIPFTAEARLLSRQRYCVGDIVLPERKIVLEVNGKAYHADKWGFERSSGRRAGLESMGYTVLDITYEHLADLEAFDALMGSFAATIGYELVPRTPEFLARRASLHRDLFSRTI